MAKLSPQSPHSKLKQTLGKYQTEEWTAEVPVDWDDPTFGTLKVFGRMVYLPKNAKKDVFVFLQGGPGHQCPRDPEAYEWIPEVLKNFRVFFLDQRGTGRSSVIQPSLVRDVAEMDRLERHLSCFRADSIVKDAEYFRENVFKIKKWFLLGQSYGGFCSFTYLSFAPHGLKGVITTGGVPPWHIDSVDKIYKELVSICYKRNQEWYRTFPKHVDIIKRIMDVLVNDPVKTADGGKLSPDRFRFVGTSILGSTRYASVMHAFLDCAFGDANRTKLSYQFLKACTDSLAFLDFESHPIYAFLQEAVYANAMSTHWSAARVLKEHGGFGLEAKKICLYGETVVPSLFTDCAGLVPFRPVAHRLAEKEDWKPLYDPAKLAKNKVPVECLVYQQDYYISHPFSLKAVKETGAARAYVHPEWQHDSLRQHGKELIGIMLPRLLKRV